VARLVIPIVPGCLGAECGVGAALLLCGIVLGLRDRFPGGTWPVRGIG
jgi:hypothetical protein